jgi:2-polyprenyl-3-methyl-5-hydroxy-6-metoxy-1,4-benzoquinol methylase
MTKKQGYNSPEDENATEGVTGRASKCRVCKNAFYEKPLLRYDNMPAAAQYLPDAVTVENDRGVDLEIRQCSGCGLVQLDSGPVPYYRDVIRAAAFSDEMKDFRLKQFSDFVSKYSLAGKKIVEIGCGCGEYLSLMQKTGADAYGLEHLVESVQKCANNELKVRQGFIESSEDVIPDAPFDAFYILNFLEHLPAPNTVLRGIYNNLSDNAVGLVEVPNFDMILRVKLFSEFIGDHLFYFTKDTLTTALKLNGFEVVECNEIWHEYIISAIVRKRTRLDISGFYEYQEKLKKEIDEYICGFGAKKVAIWGAGHQALAIISMLGLKDGIRYVVDSAPFKQGKYTPATHIPIVAPDTLNTDPVDAVIIIAASYSDEVAEIIGRKFGRRMHVSILRDYGLEEIEYDS